MAIVFRYKQIIVSWYVVLAYREDFPAFRNELNHISHITLVAAVAIYF